LSISFLHSEILLVHTVRVFQVIVKTTHRTFGVIRVCQVYPHLLNALAARQFEIFYIIIKH